MISQAFLSWHLLFQAFLIMPLVIPPLLFMISESVAWVGGLMGHSITS
jgi:hypothetical protein